MRADGRSGRRRRISGDRTDSGSARCTAARAYRDAFERQLGRAFSTGAEDAHLTYDPLTDSLDVGARAAAVCVTNAFIEHAAGLDGCQSDRGRRSASSDVAV